MLKSYTNGKYKVLSGILILFEVTVVCSVLFMFIFFLTCFTFVNLDYALMGINDLYQLLYCSKV